MREIPVRKVRDAVENLFLRANTHIKSDVKSAMREAYEAETFPPARETLRQLLENDEIAREREVAICQDTGMSVIFLDIGQDVHFTGGDLYEAVNEGVASAYEKGFFRKSVIIDPLFERKNTLNNTPAVIHARIVPGDRLYIAASPKGFGSENMSRIAMLSPGEGANGAVRFIVDTVISAGPNPCPPVVVGVCIGGTFDSAPLYAKKMTYRPVGSENSDFRYAELEKTVLRKINASGIGPGGTGGGTTALCVNIDHQPTHIAGMPVAVNICCHCARHGEAYL